ncbi:histidinol phosphate phosphatase [Clostridium sp. WILCCON 0269]|uniref:Histidinol-phosphatase n=1 Tax=Candidatus Clostridium eludens TaxID=3381663 RepID=A0ABW8SMU1_9CLOT
MFDTHIHTTFSTDSNMKIEDAIKCMEEKNISLIVTEHMDVNFPKKDSFCFNVDDYFNTYSKYRNNNLLLGIELGMKEDCIEESRKLIENNSFDYVIGSIHLVDNLDLYYPDYYKDKSKKEAYLKYLQVMLENLKEFYFIDSLGHIDYIARYAKFEDRELYYKDFSDIIDDILKEIIKEGKCLELNTRRLCNNISVKNMIEIYKRFNELGGKYITVGSDAHQVEAIGNNFMAAKEMAQLCNLKIVYFKNRVMEYDRGF